jgi:sn-glycerol 3-phosphate transport system substrate-binding protein
MDGRPRRAAFRSFASEGVVTDAATATTIDVWLANHPIPDFNRPVMEAAESFSRAHPGYEIRIREIGFHDLPGEVSA